MSNLNFSQRTSTRELIRTGAGSAFALDFDESIFDRPPVPLRVSTLRDRVEGMLYGLMIGDSLGNTSEAMSPNARRLAFGEIRDYLPNRHAGLRRVGLPSDDTQLAFWTIESLLEHGRLEPDALAAKFCARRIFGIGRTVREFVRRYRDERVAWHEAGPASAGNGALMRISPVLLPHLASPDPQLWSDAAIAAAVTHNDRSAIGSSVALVSVLWDLLGATALPEPDWWVRRYVDVLRPLEGNSNYASLVPGDEYKGPLWTFLEDRLPAAHARGWSASEGCDSWYSGAYLLETVPSVLYILMKHAHDPEEAIVRSVNDTWDNDTVAAVVGAAVGALHGRSKLPPRWIEGLLGRSRESDDGHAFRLIDEACARRVEPQRREDEM